MTDIPVTAEPQAPPTATPETPVTEPTPVPPEPAASAPEKSLVDVGDEAGDLASEATDEGTAKEDEPKPGAPEKYDDFVLPEGMTLDPAATEQFAGVAKELNLSQEQAQKLVDLQAKMVKDASDKQVASWNETVSKWKSETSAALGANLKTEMANVGRAMNAFGSQGLREIMNQSGLGNHKEVVAFMAKIGKAIGEDTLVEGMDEAAKPKTMAERMYPNQGKK